MSLRTSIQRQRMTLRGGSIPPTDLIECEYLESNGHQFIYTGYNATQYNKWTISLQYTNLNQQLNGGYSNLASGGTVAVDIGILSDGTWFIRNGGARLSTIRRADFLRHTFTLNRMENTCFIDDDTTTFPMSYHEPNESTYTNLFARSTYEGYSKSQLFCTEKIFYNAFSDTNDVVLQELIPAFDTTNGRPCMYDTISGQRLYNLGTGEFGYMTKNGVYVAPV